MNTLEILEKLPRVIGGYEFITQNLLNIEGDKENFVNYFNDIPRGDLKEALITYDNRTYGYGLRVKNRGEELVFEFSKYKIFSDYLGPLSAETLVNMDKVFEDFPYIVEDFMNWIREDLSQNK